MADEPIVPDWNVISSESVDELLRQGETLLDALLTIGIAADARATTLCGILGGAGLALLAAAATILSGAAPNEALLIAACATAAPLLVASFLAVRAGRPADFHLKGYEPRRLAKSAASTIWMKRYAVADVQNRIDQNRRALSASADLITWAFRIALLAIPCGIASFIAVQSL